MNQIKPIYCISPKDTNINTKKQLIISLTPTPDKAKNRVNINKERLRWRERETESLRDWDEERETELRLRESQREKERKVSKMKYLEGGSTGAAEQGGMKAEVVTSDLRWGASDERWRGGANEWQCALDWTNLWRRDRSLTMSELWAMWPISVYWLEPKALLCL